MTTETDRDTAVTGDASSDQEGSGDGAPVSIDWESEDNPYKKRFSGEQSRSARLETELEAERSNRTSLTTLVNRFNDLEDMVADISDRGEVRASRSELYPYDDGLDDDTPPAATGRAKERIQESRQAQAVRERDAQANQVYTRLQQGWTDGMSADSPEMKEVTRLYNEALEDPAKAGQLNTALTLFNSYKSSVAAATAPVKPPTPTSGTDDSDGDAVDSDDDNEILEDDGSDDRLTARQRNARNGSAQGQEGSGSAPPRDFSNLTPSQKFALHEEGKSPKDY